MPEGDSLHRAARRLQVLAGQRVEVETPHPRASGKQLAERLDGLVLESVEAIGKNLLLRFEGGLVLRGAEHEAVLWNGPVLELGRDAGSTRRLGPDILAEPPAVDAMLARMRAEPQDREIGDALLDQRLVAGIGNVWRAEALWEARVSPWRPLAEVTDEEVCTILESAHRLMRTGVEGTRARRHVY